LAVGEELQGLLELGVHLGVLRFEFLQALPSQSLIEFLLECRDLCPGLSDLFGLREIDEPDKQPCQEDNGSRKIAILMGIFIFSIFSNNAPVFMSHRSAS